MQLMASNMQAACQMGHTVLLASALVWTLIFVFHASLLLHLYQQVRLLHLVPVSARKCS